MKKSNIIPEQVTFGEPSHMSSSNGAPIKSRDFYKGTSFRWSGPWELGKHYSNDTYFIDFVSHNNAIYVCLKSHYAASEKDFNDYWEIAVHPGKEGVSGKAGASALHVGIESPCEYKNMHVDNPTIQEQYAYCENMLWINPEEAAEIDYKTWLYNAYKACGGELSDKQFFVAFTNLGNTVTADEILFEEKETDEDVEKISVKDAIQSIKDEISSLQAPSSGNMRFKGVADKLPWSGTMPTDEFEEDSTINHKYSVGDVIVVAHQSIVSEENLDQVNTEPNKEYILVRVEASLYDEFYASGYQWIEFGIDSYSKEEIKNLSIDGGIVTFKD